MPEMSLPEKIDKLRVEFEAILNVLMARVSTANDLEDWTVIESQTRELLKVARKAKNYAGI
jgi:hypothetical protein